ncbi:hypothetical protein Y032_0052g2267 [Ancylostoma ceylanicum]|uniref:Uncharacterized protein n=1 Tax=Ancylostoma ceylanicum TaxID=53326 RepID=A0A016U8B7_9BILA|nr:hypothetical protein Y032_0052g2267 [Ancylostoma ceylanicum]
MLFQSNECLRVPRKVEAMEVHAVDIEIIGEHTRAMGVLAKIMSLTNSEVCVSKRKELHEFWEKEDHLLQRRNNFACAMRATLQEKLDLEKFSKCDRKIS